MAEFNAEKRRFLSLEDVNKLAEYDRLVAQVEELRIALSVNISWVRHGISSLNLSYSENPDYLVAVEALNNTKPHR